MRRIGCHVSIAGGIINAPKRAADLGCEVLQMFTRSPRGGAAPVITPEIAKQFKEEMKTNGQGACFIHTPYYINFASSDNKNRDASIRIVREELERGSLIGAQYIMTHLGSSKDNEREGCLKLVGLAVKEILKDYKGSTELLLEISAGSGNAIGHTFEELQKIRDYSGHDVGVCIDTAHLFGSGYDIRDKAGVAQTMKTIKDTVGKKTIKLIHANDSKVDLASRVDRHDHIGIGKIGRLGFELLMAEFNLDLILETEHDKVADDIKILKAIRSKL